MSAVAVTYPAGVLLAAAAITTETTVVVASDRGEVLGVDVRITEDGTNDFALLEVTEPEQLERLAAEMVVAAQKLRDARDARKPVVPS